MAQKPKTAKTKTTKQLQPSQTVIAKATAGKPVVVVANGKKVTIQKPRSRRKAFKDALAPADGLVDDLVFDNVGGFVTFLREHAIVGLAVGFVIGAQVQAVVKQLIASFIDPFSKLLFGGQLSKQTFTLNWRHGAADFGWGAFAYVLVDFLFVLAIIYVVIKFLKLDKLDLPKPKK